MGVEERYKKKKEEEKSNTLYNGVENRYLSKNVDTIGKEIANRVNTWITNNNNYFSNAQHRFSGDMSKYRSDSSNWLSTVTTQRDNFQKEADSIKRVLEQYKDFFEADYVNSVIEALDGNLKAQESVISAATQDRDFWSQFDSEDSYNSWYKDYREKQDVLTSADYEEYSKLGANVDNPSWNEAHAWLDIGGWTPFGKGETINNMVTFAEANRNKAYGLQNRGYSGATEHSEMVLLIDKYMTDEEKGIYNYYVGKGDTAKANEYLKKVSDVLRQREAGEYAEMFGRNAALTTLFAVSAGLDQFSSGIKNLDNFFTGAEADPTTSTQYASQIIRQDLNGFMGGVYDLTQTTANMLPSILVGSVTGGVGGTLTMGAGVVGNAYAEMRELGYDEWQSRGYAVLTGVAESALQYALGGISPLGNASGGVLSKAVTKALGQVDNAIARVAIQIGAKMFDEGIEEATQSILEPIFKTILTGDKFDVDWGEVAYSGLLGALSAGLLEGVPTIGGTVKSSSEAKNVYGNNVQGLVAESLDIDPNNAHAQRMQTRLDNGKNVSGYQINRLLEANSEALLTQDKAKIKSAVEAKLTEYGETGNISAIADVLVKQASGEKLTSKEVKILNESKAGHRVWGGLNKTNIESGALSDDWASHIGTRVIHPEVYNKDLYELARQRAGIEEDSVTQALAESEGASEAQIEVSDNGKSMYYDAETDSYLDADIKRIVSTKGGVKVELENGKTVKASDLRFATREEGVVYEMLARMDVTPETANEIINTFKPTDANQADLYFDSIPLAYRMGLMGNEKGLKYINLSEDQKRIVYNRGRIDAITNAKARDNARATSPRQAQDEASYEKKGIIFEDGFVYDEATANDLQRAGIAGAEAIAKTTNLEVHVFESKVVDGKRVASVNGKLVAAPNGYFTDGNKIYIDINAGMNAEGAMLYALSHEVTHYIRKWNAQGFKDLADFLIAEYGKNGVDVTGLIARQKDKIKKRYSEEGKALPNDAKLFDMAYEELVADAMSDMLADPKAYEKLEKFKKKNFKVWKKLGEVIKQVLDKLKSALNLYRGKSPVATEAFKVRDFTVEAYNKLQDLYIKAFVEADNNYSSAEQTLVESGIAVNSDTDSASLLSVRDVLSDEQRKKVSSALATRFGVTQEEAMEWLKAETSMASLILNPKYSQYLDYTPDPNEVAIKQNSDYPQGTVDFSPICAKRREFTSVMNNILRLFPNHVFAATDLAKIRTIMQEEGMTIPCGICYVEDRRQLDTIVAQNFIDSLKLYREGSKIRPDGKSFNTNQLKGLSLIDGDSYIPSVYELVSLEGLNVLKEKNPNMAEAWVKFNNARGMQSVRLLANEAEYKRQILKYTKQTVKAKNDKGGLRVYSFSDAEMFHLIDIIQVITDSATVGLSLQGYTKVNEYARAVKDTGEKLNRSLIPKGELGYHIEDGKVILDYDTVEGIDINHPDFFDNRDNPNVGNITIGVSDVQIRAAMVSDFVDQIIPFHTGQSEEVLGEKGISTWFNYKDFQTEKDIATGKVSDHQINIYTEVLQVLEKEGKPITKRTFVEKFLQVCKDNGLTPRFSQFLNTNENGEYVYTEGYHKMLVDFKTFAQTEVGEYLPQMPVKPIFDNEYITKILKDYVKSQKVKDAELTKSMPKVIERITNEIVKPSDSEVKFSDRDNTPNEFNPDGKTLDEQLDDILHTAESYDGRYLYIGRFTPEFISMVSKHATIKDLPVAMNYRDAYLSMESNEHGKYKGNGINYHNLGKEGLKSAIESFESPEQVLLSKTNGKVELILEGVDRKGNKLLSIVALNTVTRNAKKYIEAHIVTSIYGKRNIERYVSKAEQEGRLIYSKKEESAQGNSQVQYEGIINANSSANSISQSEESVKREFSDADTKYSIREEAPPKKTVEGYKVFVVKNGKLYPPMVANPNAVDTPVGVWLNADVGTRAADSKTGRPQVKAGGKGTQGGSGSLAFRPGWHLGETPLATQFDRTNPETGVKELFPENFVWALCDIAADHDYQEEAMSYGYNKNGKFQHSLAGLPKLPKDGYYKYRTNPNPDTVPWLITGAMKVKRLLSDAEVNAILESKGLPPKQRVGGNKTLADLGLAEYEDVVYSDRDYSEGLSETDKIIADRIIERLKQRTMSSKYGVVASGAYTAERIERELAYSSAEGHPDYANSYITWISPDDFINATTGSAQVRDILTEEAGTLDVERLSKERQPIYLRVDFETGEIVGHEGRHRMIALKKAGIDRVAVVIEARNNDLYNTKPINMMHLQGQYFNQSNVGRDFYLHDALPLSQRYASIVTELFSHNPKNGVRFSDRDTDSVSNRTLLANALESVAQNDIEKAKLAQYKKKIALIESEQKKLNDLKARANALRFTKGRTSAETKQMRDLEFEANQTANRINTYDKQLLNLESTSALKNVLEREKTILRKKIEQKGREALNAQRARNAETVREIMNRNTESRKKAIESRHKTEMRHKIKKVVSDLNKLLLKPTNEQHVPIGLQGVVADALDAINMDTMNAEERVKYYNDLIAMATNPDEKKRLTEKRDFFAYRDMNFKERITALKNAYAEFKESDDPLIRNAHNDAIADLISNTASAVGNTSLKDMSYAQLEAVYDMYKAVLATVRNANKMFKEGRQQTVTGNSEAVKVEVKEVGGHQDRVLKVTKFLKKAGWDMLKPITAMKVIGSKTLAKLFDNVRAAEDTWAVDVSEAKDFYEAISKKYGYNKWDFKTRYNFKDSQGADYSISLEQMMSLYAYSKREQADEHLEFGGFIFDDAIEITEKKLGIPVKYEVNDANPYRLGKTQVMEIIGKLTQDQKAFIDEMQTYLSDVMGAKGNEVSLALYDIKLYKEKNYFPLKTARYFREFNPEQSGTPMIRNSGFSKKTVPKAGNPIVLSNFMDVWASHVNDMSMYHSFVLPLEDFMRVYNYSSTAGGYDSVQQYIKNAYGSQANQYIERLMDDLNGGARVDSSAGIINKGLSLFKKASVFASASVVVQQPSAIARALAYINPKHFATSVGSALNLKKHKEVWAEVRKYAPVAVIKEMGYFDTGMGRSTVEWIKGNKTIKDKMDDILSKAPAKADELSWSYIWLAVKKEIQATTNLTPDTEEFLKKAGERFTEIITNTQVYDSVLARSGMMRSKDTGMKMATAFMAEPTTTVNMMVDGIIQGKRGNKKFTASTVGAISTSIILNSILVALVYAARDDDEDETYTEKYVGSLISELLDGFNPLTYIPFIKDAWSIAQGYDVERSDMSVVSNLWESIEGLFKEDKGGWEKVSDATGAVSSLFGIPLKNLIRDAKGMYNLTKTLTSGTPTTGAGLSDAVEDAFTSSIPLWDRLHESDSKTDKLYEAILSGDQAHISRIRSGYEDEKDFESAMRQALRDNDSRIKEAAQARLDGNISEYTRIVKEIIREGNFSQDIVVGAINAEMNAIKRGEAAESEPTEDKDEVTSIYSGSDINSAFESGDNALANEIISELIEAKVANGMEEKEAKSSLRSSMTSYWKPLYKQAYQSGDTEEMARIRKILYSSGLYGKANDVVKTTQSWLKN